MKTKAHARNTDPETSREAAESITGMNARQCAVLAVFKHPEPSLYASDERLIEAYRKAWGDNYHQSDSGIRSRRAELVRKGLIADSGQRVKTASGRNSIVWRLA